MSFRDELAELGNNFKNKEVLTTNNNTRIVYLNAFKHITKGGDISYLNEQLKEMIDDGAFDYAQGIVLALDYFKRHRQQMDEFLAVSEVLGIEATKEVFNPLIETINGKL